MKEASTGTTNNMLRINTNEETSYLSTMTMLMCYHVEIKHIGDTRSQFFFSGIYSVKSIDQIILRIGEMTHKLGEMEEINCFGHQKSLDLRNSKIALIKDEKAREYKDDKKWASILLAN